MFDSISEKFSSLIKKIKTRGHISESDINEYIREIRISLLESDVALQAVKHIVACISAAIVEQNIAKCANPGAIIENELRNQLIAILSNDKKINDSSIKALSKTNTSIMLVGPHGSGKTTTAAKLAYYISKKFEQTCVVSSLDFHRPAASEQLKKLIEKANKCFDKNKKNDVQILFAESGVSVETRIKEVNKLAESGMIKIFDLPGCSLNTDISNEIIDIKKMISPTNTLLVIDAMTGQDTTRTTKQFEELIGISGIILSKADSDFKGGTAISVSFTTNKPIRFLGIGETPQDIELFEAERIVDRIIGRGDIKSIIEKMEDFASEDSAKKLAERAQKGIFTLNDMLSQLECVSKFGGVSKIFNAIPGLSQHENINEKAEKITVKNVAIVRSMTKKERGNPDLINGSRKRRIASGSGTQPKDVNLLLKQYKHIATMMKSIRGKSPNSIGRLLKFNKQR